MIDSRSAALLLALASSATAQTFLVESLGFLGGSFARAQAINASGVIAGEALLAPPGITERAFRTDTSGIIDLGTLGGSRSRALSIADDGTIGGWALGPGGQQTPAIWTGAGIGALPTLGGTTGAVWSVLSATSAVGQSRNASGSNRATVWTNGAASGLPGLGGSASIAYDGNASGRIVGSADTATPTSRAVFWDSTGITDIGGLGGGSWTAARAVNESGAMILWGIPAGSTSNRATLWSGAAGDTPVSLGTFGGPESWAYGLNNHGHVVGTADTASGLYHGFAWYGSELVNLGTLGGLFSAALGINDAGVIVGWAMDAQNRTHAVRWTPIPEPSTYAVLLAVAVLGLVLCHPRRA